MSESSKVVLFKHSTPYIGVILSTGFHVKFVNHRFWTQDKDVEAELLRLAKTRQAGIYVDKDDATFDINEQSPIAQIEAAAVRKYLEAQRNRATPVAPGNTQPALNPAQLNISNSLEQATNSDLSGESGVKVLNVAPATAQSQTLQEKLAAAKLAK